MAKKIQIHLPEQNHASFQEGITIKIVAVGFILTVLLSVLILNFVWSQQKLYGRPIENAETHYCCCKNSQQSRQLPLIVSQGTSPQEIQVLCNLNCHENSLQPAGYDNRCTP